MKQSDELRLLVRDALRECSAEATPNFFEMVKTASGYQKAEDMVINFAVKNQLSVTAAIAQLESTLSDE